MMDKKKIRQAQALMADPKNTIIDICKMLGVGPAIPGLDENKGLIDTNVPLSPLDRFKPGIAGVGRTSFYKYVKTKNKL